MKRPCHDAFRQAKFSGGHDVRAVSNPHAAADRARAVPKGHPARLYRSIAGVLQPARRQGASDLEADRAGHERFRADANADHDLCRLPATRRYLRARWLRHRRHDQRRGNAGLPAPASTRREIHHLGLHGIAGVRRGWPAERLPRGDALDGDGFSFGLRRDPDQDARLRRPKPRHRRRRHRRD